MGGNSISSVFDDALHLQGVTNARSLVQVREKSQAFDAGEKTCSSDGSEPTPSIDQTTRQATIPPSVTGSHKGYLSTANFVPITESTGSANSSIEPWLDKVTNSFMELADPYRPFESDLSAADACEMDTKLWLVYYHLASSEIPPPVYSPEGACYWEDSPEFLHASTDAAPEATIRNSVSVTLPGRGEVGLDLVLRLYLGKGHQSKRSSWSLTVFRIEYRRVGQTTHLVQKANVSLQLGSINKKGVVHSAIEKVRGRLYEKSNELSFFNERCLGEYIDGELWTGFYKKLDNALDNHIEKRSWKSLFKNAVP